MATEMRQEFVTAVIGDISALLERASSLSKGSVALSAQGLVQNAMDTQLDIEPLLFEATTLLNAASLVFRRLKAGD